MHVCDTHYHMLCRSPYQFGTIKDVRGAVEGGAKGAAGLFNASDPALAKLIHSLRETLIKFGGT